MCVITHLPVMEVSPPKARLYVKDALAKGQIVTLDKDQSHYLLKVMRQKIGAQVALFNGHEGEWWGEISDDNKKAAAITLQQQTRVQQEEPDIWLCFAPVKFGKIDFLAQKATELGVSKLMPVETKRTIVNRVKHDRLVANAMEAAEQSERLTVPEVENLQTFGKLIADWPQDRLLIVADETGGGEPPLEMLPVLRDSRLAVLIGPEGGFAPEELKQLSMLPGVRKMSLGPRILRADTAALAALTCIQALCGDWRDGVPKFRGEDENE